MGPASHGHDCRQGTLSVNPLVKIVLTVGIGTLIVPNVKTGMTEIEPFLESKLEIPVPEAKAAEPKTVDQLIDAYFPAHARETAKRVAACESGKRPEAVGDQKIAFMQDGELRGMSYGVFQIRDLPPKRPNKEWLLNAENNVAYAAHLFYFHKWTPWVRCSQKLGL